MEGFLMSENGSFGWRVMRKHTYKGEEKIWQRGGSEPQNVPMQMETGGNQEQRWKGCPCKKHSDFHRSTKSRRLLKLHVHVLLDSKACFHHSLFVSCLCLSPLPYQLRPRTVSLPNVQYARSCDEWARTVPCIRYVLCTGSSRVADGNFQSLFTSIISQQPWKAGRKAVAM